MRIVVELEVLVDEERIPLDPGIYDTLITAVKADVNESGMEYGWRVDNIKAR